MKATTTPSNGNRHASLPAAQSRGDQHPDLRHLTGEILRQEELLRQGGGPSGQERQKKLGRLTARQRVAGLIDDKSPFLELGLWAAHDMYPQAGSVPAAGVITGIGQVQRRSCMIVANDATVKAGAFFPATVKKILRAQRIAARCNLPLVYLVDSAGVYLPMQDEIFPDEDDFGRIFRNNAVLSAMGVPQFAAIMGNCVAGGAYLPVLCDKILATATSELYLAGPTLVQAAIGQIADAHDLGGAPMHARVSGTVDFLEPDDETCLHRLRSLIALTPGEIETVPGTVFTQTETPPDAIYALPHEYDSHTLLAAVVDAGSLQEYKADYGQTLICAYASIGRHNVGIVANQRRRTSSAAGEVQIGGVIYGDAADKAARFVMDCSQSGLPIVFIQDVMGFMVGRDSEQHGIIRRGAKLVNAVSNCTVPKITVIVGGSFGAGNYALCGKAFDPAFIFAWPNARYAVMGAEQAASTILSVQQRHESRAGRHRSPDELQALHDAIKADYERQTDIRYGAARGWVDAIIAPHTTRDVLIQALELATRPPPPGGFRAGVFQV